MKQLFFSCIVVLIVCFASSCKQKNNIENEIRNFKDSRIELSLDSMQNVSGKCDPAVYSNVKYIYVIYVDSTSCSDCAINNLSEWSQLDFMETNTKDERLFKYVFIISPKQHQSSHVRKTIENYAVFNDFIFLDTCKVFDKRNPNLPKNKLLHTFLLDKDRNVVLVGNPLTSTKIREMLLRILNKPQ